jgi:hypothetical protein
MTPEEIRLKELRSLRDKLMKNRDANQPELIWIRQEIRDLQDYITAERRARNAPKKKSKLDSINADKYFWANAEVRF